MKQQLFTSTFLLLLSNVAFADLPLTVENFLSDKGKSRSEFSTTYVNSERRGVDTDSISVQTNPTTSVNIPIVSGENHTNTDVLVFTVGVTFACVLDG